jgi:hypothetical protein
MFPLYPWAFSHVTLPPCVCFPSSSSSAAAAAVAAALAGPQTDDITFEVYAAKNKYPLQFGFPNKSGFEHTGQDWPQIFDGLKTDTQLAEAIKSSK